MKSLTIPLAGSYNQRGIDDNSVIEAGQDQRFLNCAFSLVKNPITQSAEFYVEKRQGWGVDSVVSAGNSSTGLIKPLSFNGTISAFGDTNSTIFFGSTSVGTITGRAIHFTEVEISGQTYILIRSSDGSGWYYVEGAKDQLTYTCDGNNSTTITDIKVGGVPSVSGLYVGQQLTAASNITAGSRIVSINAGAFSAVLDTATTGGAFNDLSTTKEPIAKIIDSDFITTGTYISAFAEMDGFVFYTTDDGNVRNSNLNSVTAYNAIDTLSPNLSPDEPRAITRQGQAIVVLGSASKEVYSNPGTNSVGSPLQRQTGYFQNIGVLDQRSLTKLNDDIYFISSPQEGDIGVYRIRGLQAEKVSPPEVDSRLGTVSAASGAFYANSFRLGGYPYVGFFLSSASEVTENILLENSDFILLENGDNILLDGSSTQSSSFVTFLVYNASLDMWSEWDSMKCTFVESVGSGTSNQLYATSRVETDGKIYTINPAANGELYTDDGDSYSLQIRTSKNDFGTEVRKTVISVTLMGSDISNTTATLEYSDDDYATWTTAGTFDLSTPNPRIYRCGSFKGARAWRLTHSAPSAFRAKALKFDFNEGVH